MGAAQARGKGVQRWWPCVKRVSDGVTTWLRANRFALRQVMMMGTAETEVQQEEAAAAVQQAFSTVVDDLDIADTDNAQEGEWATYSHNH